MKQGFDGCSPTIKNHKFLDEFCNNKVSPILEIYRCIDKSVEEFNIAQSIIKET